MLALCMVRIVRIIRSVAPASLIHAADCLTKSINLLVILKYE